MLNLYWSDNQPIKYEHIFIFLNFLYPMPKNSYLYTPSILNYWENSHTHGLFGWVNCCSVPTMRLLSTSKVTILDLKVVFDLSLGKKEYRAKFDCIGYYKLEIFEAQRQTNKLYSLYIRFPVSSMPSTAVTSNRRSTTIKTSLSVPRYSHAQICHASKSKNMPMLRGWRSKCRVSGVMITNSSSLYCNIHNGTL